MYVYHVGRMGGHCWHKESTKEKWMDSNYNSQTGGRDRLTLYMEEPSYIQVIDRRIYRQLSLYNLESNDTRYSLDCFEHKCAYLHFGIKYVLTTHNRAVIFFCRHIGDLGNLEADDKGNVNVERTDHILTLRGQYSILGRMCVVRSSLDQD